jgi:hypothetical protein
MLFLGSFQLSVPREPERFGQTIDVVTCSGPLGVLSAHVPCADVPKQLYALLLDEHVLNTLLTLRAEHQHGAVCSPLPHTAALLKVLIEGDEARRALYRKDADIVADAWQQEFVMDRRTVPEQVWCSPSVV